RVLDAAPRIMVDQDQVLANTGPVYTLKGRVVAPSKPLRSTLAWTDAPGSPAATPWVNDLDLQVDLGGRACLGYHFNRASRGGGGGGGGGAVDSPPTVNIKYPLGGEHITVGSFLRVLWDASDDKGIQSQRVEFSADGLTYNLIGAVDGNARQFDWRVPAIPTP